MTQINYFLSSHEWRGREGFPNNHHHRHHRLLLSSVIGCQYYMARYTPRVTHSQLVTHICTHKQCYRWCSPPTSHPATHIKTGWCYNMNHFLFRPIASLLSSPALPDTVHSHPPRSTHHAGYKQERGTNYYILFLFSIIIPPARLVPCTDGVGIAF